MSEGKTPFYYGWVIIAYVSLIQVFTLGILFYGFGVALIPLIESLKSDQATLSIIPISTQIAFTLATPFVGVFFDKKPARMTIPASLVIFGLGLLVVSLAKNVPQLVIVHVVMLALGSIGGGAFAAQTLTAKWFARRRGLGLAITAAGGGVGGLVIPPVMAVLIQEIGWRQTYFVLGLVVLLVIAPLGVLLVRDAPKVLPDFERIPEPARRPDQAAPTARIVTTKTVVTNPIFLVTTLGMGTLVMVQMILQYYLPAMGSVIGAAPEKAAVLLSILAGAAILSKPVWGISIDRSDPRVIFVAIAIMYAATNVILLGGTGEVTYARLAIVAAISGFASGAIQALVGTILAREFGSENFGRALGLAYLFMNVNVLGPTLASLAHRQTGQYDLALYAISVLVVIAVIAFVFIVRPKRLDPPDGDKRAEQPLTS